MNIKKGYTFDDLLLVPQKSEILPKDVTLRTKLTKNITLNIPILSAAMDTVTEHKMAIALAREGGIGFIHKNMSIEAQAYQVQLVKRNENGMITNPIIVDKNTTLDKVNELMGIYKIGGLPVVENNKLIGIVTNRDIKYNLNSELLVKDVMSTNLITAPKGVTLDNAREIMQKHRIEKLPIVEGEELVGLITSKDVDSIKEYPNSCKDASGKLRCGAAVGIGTDTLERVKQLVQAGVDVISIDSAHGHSTNVIKTLKDIKSQFPQLEVIVGNIATEAAARDLIEAGADALKVGIGPGSICTTRIIAGVGVPQVTAIMDVASYAKQKQIPVIADGGIKFSGDIVKALAAGANCVMVGSLLAGCDESPGEEIVLGGRKFKAYVGMGSLAAMKRGSADRYFQNNQQNQKYVPEGIEARVAYKGLASATIYQLCGGIKSGMGYLGTKDINLLQNNHQFIEITNAGLVENHPHDVEITAEAPNYTK